MSGTHSRWISQADGGIGLWGPRKRDRKTPGTEAVPFRVLAPDVLRARQPGESLPPGKRTASRRLLKDGSRYGRLGGPCEPTERQPAEEWSLGKPDKPDELFPSAHNAEQGRSFSSHPMRRGSGFSGLSGFNSCL